MEKRIEGLMCFWTSGLLKVEHDSFFNYELKHRLLQPNKVTFRVEGAHKWGMSISPEKVNVSIMVESMLFMHTP